ncbi:hypothetical protein ACHHYP_02435 [Achlya hypogyna]|uniref:Uncharacterized protein n=1 Tax=Achlya hypogyna TaxID=1202772 RepID=A0A1V9Z6E7_ACHHY|nr:hypothetical protein ACHHYP_02435 [Achlya hypogyna]
MATPRTVQDDDVERLVKCRVRSEVEARKAAETSMKRAMKEATELKKELMIMRREKEELLDRTKVTEVTAPKSVRQPTDDLLKKLARRDKEIELCKQSLIEKEAAAEASAAQVQQLQTLLERAGVTSAALQQQADEAMDAAKKAAIELRQLKLSSDETKKKLQKSIKELKEEKQTLVAENAQLTQRLDEAASANAQTSQLKKQLQQARERLATIVADHDARVGQLAASHAAAMQELSAAHDREISRQLQAQAASHANELAEKLEATSMVSQIEKEKEQVRADAHRRLQEELQIEKEENVDLLQHEKDAAVAAKAKAEEWSAKAEKAADACEAQALKFKEEWMALDEKLAVVDGALRRRGISMDFLLKKKPVPSSNNNSAEADDDVRPKLPAKRDTLKKKPTEPEVRDESERKVVRSTRK